MLLSADHYEAKRLLNYICPFHQNTVWYIFTVLDFSSTSVEAQTAIHWFERTQYLYAARLRIITGQSSFVLVSITVTSIKRPIDILHSYTTELTLLLGAPMTMLLLQKPYYSDNTSNRAYVRHNEQYVHWLKLEAKWLFLNTHDNMLLRLFLNTHHNMLLRLKHLSFLVSSFMKRFKFYFTWKWP